MSQRLVLSCLVLLLCACLVLSLLGAAGVYFFLR
jgi:hypothetical protein